MQKMNISVDVDKNAGISSSLSAWLWFHKHQGSIVIEARRFSAERSCVGCQMGNFPTNPTKPPLFVAAGMLSMLGLTLPLFFVTSRRLSAQRTFVNVSLNKSKGPSHCILSQTLKFPILQPILCQTLKLFSI